MTLLRALAAQLSGALLGLLATRALGPSPQAFALTWAGLAGIAAAGVGRWILRQPRWWAAIHVVFPLAVTGAARLDVAPAVYAAGFAVLVLVFWRTAQGDVPLYLSSAEVVEATRAALAPRGVRRVAELGAGVGTVAVPLARSLPGATVEAWERAPLPTAVLTVRARSAANVTVQRGDFWRADLGAYDAVFAFLSPAVMARLEAKVRAEMRPGTIFISAAFACPSWAADEVQVLDDRRGTHLYIHHLPQVE